MASPRPEIYVAVVGVGLVGSEFVDQLLSLPKTTSPFRLISLSSSKRTIYDASKPIQPGTPWKSLLSASSENADIGVLSDRLAILAKETNRKVVIVDNTSSEAIADLYPDWLGKGINVITPNKKAYSGALSLYRGIQAASEATGARYLHEATVCAGLPIISTLKDLVGTGDKIKKIDGVVSGTMSYIFNEFSTGQAGGPSFSSVVTKAREKGYTEPHPADDLNGRDVARKLTVLSRIISSSPFQTSTLPELESFLSVNIQSLIPPALESIASGDEFVARLPEFDAGFEKLRDEANANGEVLRYVGIVDVEKGVVKAGLERYPITHPFATSLGGSDNILMFHTERYSPRPLIVQGAGAGAAVTAMGVLSDLLKLV